MHNPFFAGINFPLLRTQKQALLDTLDFLEGDAPEGIVDGLEGILHLIDSLQDYAVDVLGLPESDVFALTIEDNDDATARSVEEHETSAAYLEGR